jgi:hypothetical protein
VDQVCRFTWPIPTDLKTDFSFLPTNLGHKTMTDQPLNYIKVSIHGDICYLPFSNQEIQDIQNSQAQTASLQILIDPTEKIGTHIQTKIWK